MKRIEYNPDLFISYNPNYLIIEINKQEYIYYNSVRHYGCRISKLELLLLNVLYKYDNISHIIAKMPMEQQEKAKETLQRISDSQILSTNPLTDENCNQNKNTQLKVFYLHLTYRCNLNCSYCYNKSVRATNKKELSIHEWKGIVDKIAPHASLIVLTGGECFLYKDILPLMKYIKEKAPKSTLSCISNCMHDFSCGNINQTLDYLDDITFSCDSMTEEGERIGFNPQTFQKNIEYIRAAFPHIKISISKTDTMDSTKDIAPIKSFCATSGCNFTNIILNPGTYNDIEKMPPIFDSFDDETFSSDLLNKKHYTELRGKKTRCGAAKNTYSIDPIGNVYPCQSLHFKEFMMGNLLQQNIRDLRYQDDEECIPCIDEIPECTKCKVKYICGGGCYASGYDLKNNKLGHNKWLCPYNYNIAIKKLLHIKNTPLIENKE